MLVPFLERLFSGKSSKKTNFQAKTRKLNPLRLMFFIVTTRDYSMFSRGIPTKKPTGLCDLSSHSAKNRAWHGLLCMDKHRNQGAMPVIAHHHAVTTIDGTTQWQLLRTMVHTRLVWAQHISSDTLDYIDLIGDKGVPYRWSILYAMCLFYSKLNNLKPHLWFNNVFCWT